MRSKAASKASAPAKAAKPAVHAVPATPATGTVAALNTPGFPALNLAKVRNVGGGQSICLTGRMPWVRADLYKVCIAAGYVPQDKYSGSVSLVVYADPNSGSNKMRGAMLSGKPVEYVLDFVKRIGAI